MCLHCLHLHALIFSPLVHICRHLLVPSLWCHGGSAAVSTLYLWCYRWGVDLADPPFQRHLWRAAPVIHTFLRRRCRFPFLTQPFLSHLHRAFAVFMLCCYRDFVFSFSYDRYYSYRFCTAAFTPPRSVHRSDAFRAPQACRRGRSSAHSMTFSYFFASPVASLYMRRCGTPLVASRQTPQLDVGPIVMNALCYDYSFNW